MDINKRKRRGECGERLKCLKGCFKFLESYPFKAKFLIQFMFNLSEINLNFHEKKGNSVILRKNDEIF